MLHECIESELGITSVLFQRGEAALSQPGRAPYCTYRIVPDRLTGLVDGTVGLDVGGDLPLQECGVSWKRLSFCTASGFGSGRVSGRPAEIY